MSLLVLLIAFLHAIPIVLAAIVTHRRKPVWIAAAVMGIIAMATGASIFTGADLLAVVAATWWCLSSVVPPAGSAAANGPHPLAERGGSFARQGAASAGRAVRGLVALMFHLLWVLIRTLVVTGIFVGGMWYLIHLATAK